MSNMNDVKEFCDHHNACPDGRAWALTKSSMSEVFETCDRGDWLMWALCKQGALDKPTSVRLACAFALRILPEYEKRYDRPEPRSAIEAALRWVDDPTNENAYSAARAADSAATSAATSAAYWAAYSAATSAAYSAARAATSAAASAARAAESKAQCEIIRALVQNPWRKK